MENYLEPASSPKNGTGMKEVGTSKALHATIPQDGMLCTETKAGLDASSTKSGASSGEDRS